MKNWKESYHPYAMTTIVLWSLAYVLTRIALRYFTAFSLGFLRYFTASCALLLYAFATKMKPPAPSDVKWFLLSGAVGFFLYMIFFNAGCETVNASASSVLIATAPVMTALLARYILKEFINRFQQAATCIEFAGVAVMALMNAGTEASRGIFWLIFAAAAFSVYNLLLRRLAKTYTAFQTTAFSIFSGTLMLTVFSPGAAAETQGAPLQMIAAVAILGIFSSAAAYAAWAQALAKADRTASVSNYTFITPLLTSVLGFALAGEKPDLPTMAGGLIILSGMAVFYFGEDVWKKISGKSGLF